MSDRRFIRLTSRLALPLVGLVAAFSLTADGRWDRTYILGMAVYTVCVIAAWSKA